MGADLRARVAEHAAQGSRVVLLAGGAAPLADESLPAGLRPLGLVLLAEAIREEAPGTIAYLTREGVATRVISGDDPVTVGAVATAVGVPGAEAIVSGADLPADEAGLRRGGGRGRGLRAHHPRAEARPRAGHDPRRAATWR